MKKLDKNVNRKYYFHSYDPAWKTQFQEIKGVIQNAFGSTALQIEHIGSTSIDGMSAKPLIDVLVVVKNVHTIDVEIKNMEQAGYEWGRDYIEPNSILFFKTGPDGEKTQNIHILRPDAGKTKQFLVKRDYLRTHPDRAREYSRLKEANAKKYPNNYIAYRAAKEEFLAQLEVDAYSWDAAGRPLK